MTWTLLIIIGAGTIISSSANIFPIPMKDRTACETAGRNFSAESRGIGIVCLSSETGEIIRIAPQK